MMQTILYMTNKSIEQNKENKENKQRYRNKMQYKMLLINFTFFCVTTNRMHFCQDTAHTPNVYTAIIRVSQDNLRGSAEKMVDNMIRWWIFNQMVGIELDGGYLIYGGYLIRWWTFNQMVDNII